MVTVAQLVEPWTVTPVVTGSKPVSHPNLEYFFVSETPHRLFVLPLKQKQFLYSAKSRDIINSYFDIQSSLLTTRSERNIIEIFVR